MPDNTPIRLDYSDASLRILIEEYITQQRALFSLKAELIHPLLGNRRGENHCPSKHHIGDQPTAPKRPRKNQSDSDAVSL